MNFVKSKYFMRLMASLPFAIVLILCCCHLKDKNPYDQFNLILLSLFIIIGVVYYGFLKNEEIPIKTIIWYIWILILSIFPILIDTFRKYNLDIGFTYNLENNFIESIKQNNYYGVPFAILLAAYTDVLFRDNKPNLEIKPKVHVIVFILIAIIISLAWFGNYFINPEYVIDKTQLNHQNIVILLHIHFPGFLAFYVLYLKTLTLKNNS